LPQGHTSAGVPRDLTKIPVRTGGPFRPFLLRG